jgi:uncharacterized protein
MASDIEKDLNPDIRVGLAFPLQHTDWYGMFRLTQTKMEQAYHNLTMLLRTHPGERLGNPTFGCRIHQLLFEPMGNVEGEVEAAIREAVDSWLPYIMLHKVEINKGGSEDPRAVHVHITYSVDTDLQATSALAIEFSRGLSRIMGGGEDLIPEWDAANDSWYYTDEADPFYEY